MGKRYNNDGDDDGSVKNSPNKRNKNNMNDSNNNNNNIKEKNTHSISLGITIKLPENLNTDKSIIDYDHVFGLEDIKKTLRGNIAVPLNAEQHFNIEINQKGSLKKGKLLIERFMAFYGACGSGKKTVIRSFCREQQISLIEVPFWSFNPFTDTDGIYQEAIKATETSPCIILFDQCQGHYQPNSDRRVVSNMRVMLDRIVESKKAIWVIFVSNVKIDNNSLDKAVYSLLNDCVWSGKLKEGTIVMAIQSCIKRFLHSEQTFPLTARDINSIKNNCKHVIVGDIFNYIARVFSLRAKRNEKDGFLSSLSYNDHKMIPTLTDFEKCYVNIFGQNRITKYDPFEHNMQPYDDAVRDVSSVSYGFGLD